ncbi:AAA family ATPase [Pseudonocardia sp. RS11V-5]|uniref:ATP-binding protein n=1 Tax=Pseudonocardia terrae TaxID=2905831 RepID=UPI001E40C8BA|nr:AAA family ATPase [Pseudonocardia terrae]MCE3550901.1 AAA family ATPase [Pseudonocardia terrae]
MTPPDDFVGRREELRVLAAEFDRARSGQARVVWLTGEAGIGKTSVLHRFRDRSGAGTVLWVGADEAEAGLPYGLLQQLLADVPAELVADLPLLGTGPAPGADPVDVGAALLEVLGALQAAGPVLIVVDDAQWADELSVRALVFVVRRLRRDQILLVAGVRAEDTPSPAWGRILAQEPLLRRLALSGLDADEVGALSVALGGPELPPAAAVRLRDHTEGHPMHVRALVEEIPPADLLDLAVTLPAPRSFGSLVLVRVAALSRPAQEVVLAAAVLGVRAALSDVAALAGVPDPLAALGEAVGAGALQEVPAGVRPDVVFRHPLIRAAVYADLPPERRHRLHAAAAGRLGGAAALEHRIAAAVGPDPELAAELQKLGEAERATRRWRDSAAHLLAAADLSPSHRERSARLVGAMESMLAGGDLGAGLRAEPEVRAAEPSPGRSRVLGRLAALTGRFAVAREELTAAVDRSGPDPGRRAAAAHLALVSLIEGDTARAVASAEEALALDGAADVASTARFVLVVALAAEGRHDDARAVLDAGPSGPESVEARALRGILALWTGDAAGAARILSGVVDDRAQHLPMQGRLLALGYLAEAHYRTGDWQEATVEAELAISLARDAGVVMGSGVVRAIAAYVAAGRGDRDAARAHSDAAAGVAQALPWWGGRAYAALAAATLAQAEHDHAAVLEALRPFDDPALSRLLDNVGPVGWRVLHTEALLGLGREREADAALRALEARVADRPAGWSGVEAARLRGLREELRPDRAAAEHAYRRGLETAGGVAAALSRARLEVALGRLLLTGPERRPAVDLLRTAHDRLARLGAAPFLAECDDMLRSAGLHPPSPGDALGLTPQELAVARSVAAGRTNRETGAALFITGRTVAFHLSNIYAKLGLSSRRELAARLQELDAPPVP